MIYHDIVGLHISMHYALAVTEIQSLRRLVSFSKPNFQFPHSTYLEQLKYVVSDIHIHEFRVETSKVRIVDILKNEGWRLALIVSDNIQQCYNIRPT